MRRGGGDGRRGFITCTSRRQQQRSPRSVAGEVMADEALSRVPLFPCGGAPGSLPCAAGEVMADEALSRVPLGGSSKDLHGVLRGR